MKRSRPEWSRYSFLALSLTLLCVSAVVRADDVHRPITDVVQRHTLHHSRAVTNLVWSPDSRLLATVGIRSPHISIWDAQSGKLVRKLQRKIAYGHPISFSSDGQYLITSATENREGAAFTVWERGSWKVHRHVSVLFPDKTPNWSAARLISVAASQSNLAYYPSFGHKSQIAILDTTSWKSIKVIGPFEILPRALAYTRDGRKLALGGIRGKIFVVDPSSDDHSQTIQAYPGSSVGIDALAFSADGKSLASGHNGLHLSKRMPNGKARPNAPPPHPVRVWRVSDGMPIANASGIGTPIHGISWSPDGQYLVFPQNHARERRFQIQLWNISRNTQKTVMVFAGAAFSPAFSPDGKYLAAAGRKIVRIAEIQR